MTWKLWSLIFFVGLVTGPALAVSMSPPLGGDVMLVIVPPWVDADRAIVAAGGEPIGPVRALFGQFAVGRSPDFLTEVRTNGAWAVADGRVLAQLCGVKR